MNTSNHSWKKSQMILTIVFIPFAIQHFDVVLTRLNGILTQRNIFQKRGFVVDDLNTSNRLCFLKIEKKSRKLNLQQ